MDYNWNKPTHTTTRSKARYFFETRNMPTLLCLQKRRWTLNGLHQTKASEIEISEKAANFHSIAIMLELVGRFYSRKNMPPVLTPKNSNETTNDSTDAFCICRQGETDTMVACDNQKCPYKWFHLSWLRITKSQLPKDCDRLPEFIPKRRCTRKWL